MRHLEYDTRPFDHTGPSVSDTTHEREGGALEAIAVIGLHGRFPGAANIEQFWQNLRDGVESIVPFTDEELEASGIGREFIDHPDYVKAGTFIDGAEDFDAAFFGFSPREAEIMDPQQRVFLESCWELLEASGYNSNAFDGLIGVYAGTSLNSYLLNNVLTNPDVMATVGGYQVMISNDKDFLTTRASYKLNLTGPSVVVQTACSTGLVAINMACDSLIDHRCDLALAGGVSLSFPQKAGYLYQPGMILSPDGHCRPFDERAQGTVGGKGIALVALKRLDDAMADGDQIHAVIRGWAVNNDGSLKVGYTAPSVEGQAGAIAEALAMAQFDPTTMGYVEAHGTGTELGDPIEVSALSLVYGEGTEEKQFCALGSLKSNIGHLDAAAGAAGLIKAVLAVEHGELPPSLHYEEANPQIDFSASPFFVNDRLRKWVTDDGPRRAAVSSFGIGGTNAHAVLEEAPAPRPTSSSRPAQLLTLSAKSEGALSAATQNLADFLDTHREIDLADVAYTLGTGRRRFEHRRALVGTDVEGVIASLRAPESGSVVTEVQTAQRRSCVFLFTGQGAQYVNMGRGLYDAEAAFRSAVDECSAALEPHLGIDLRSVLYPAAADEKRATERLTETWLTQPALFTVEYALAQLWTEWGIQPDAMLGHSIGEYVAACMSGVFSLSDALALVATRGRLMQGLPGGAMLAVALPESDLLPLLDEDLSIAALNTPSMSVVSGTFEAAERLERRFAEKGIACRRLQTSHAFHSPMMDPIVESFGEAVAAVAMETPQVPFVSNVTGTWIKSDDATDPRYWASHIRKPVRFAEGIAELFRDPERVFLEVGPGTTLVSLTKQQPGARGRTVVPSVRHPKEEVDDGSFVLASLGRLWAAGAHVDWGGFYGGERRRRVALPTYPFERRRYYLEPGRVGRVEPAVADASKRSDIAEWFYYPSWKRTAQRGAATDGQVPAGTWLVFDEGLGFGESLCARLRKGGCVAVSVVPGDGLERVAEDSYRIDPRNREDYEALLEELVGGDRAPQHVVHLWGLAPHSASDDPRPEFAAAQERGLYSVVSLAQAVHDRPSLGSVNLTVIGSQMHKVHDGDSVRPEGTTVLAACVVIPQEFPELRCSVIDVAIPDPAPGDWGTLTETVLRELGAEDREAVVAYRGRHRWTVSYDPAPRRASDEGPSLLRKRGRYVVTGGLGGVGLAVAERLVTQWDARVALLGRSGLPARDSWAKLLDGDPEDPRARKVRRIQELERSGGEIVTLQADVSDTQELSEAFRTASERLGGIDGVIHAAGVVGGSSFRELGELTREAFEVQFAPKVGGVYALEEVLKGHEGVEFCLLVGSISTVLGGLGYAAYAAANRFLDGFAEAHEDSDGLRWLVADWDAWRFDDEAMGGPLASLAMSPPEGAETVERVLGGQPETRLVVSTGDLGARLAQWAKHIPEDGLPAGEEDARGEPRQARPAVHSDYVEPEGDAERAVARIWEDLLGIQGVGSNDNFLELGGNSLLAVQVMSRIRQLFEVSVPIQTLFEAPTPSELAERIETARWVRKSREASSADSAQTDGDREEVVF